ncbi:MAG: terpene cyclase/mutase family protein [Pirellulales bacterium]|nr:terpene cyclase/mutase family protein [Pirellulales bacterium]
MGLFKKKQENGQTQPVPIAEPEWLEEELSLGERFKQWILHDSPSWMISALFHTVLLLLVGLFMGGQVIVDELTDATVIESANEEADPKPLEPFDLAGTPEEPTELTTESLTMEPPAQEAREAIKYDDSGKPFEMEGGGTESGLETGVGGLGLNIKASGLGPVLSGKGGVESGRGTGQGFGKGGAGIGFGGRGQGAREAMLARAGGTKQTERAVAGALNWLARHQSNDGSWSIDNYACPEKSCTGVGTIRNASAAGTALGLLPFLAAGQTHQSKGPYKTHITKAVNWLIGHQARNGDLSAGGSQMYSHGLAAIALCEAYGMTNDSHIRHAAQGAIQFIEAAQNEEGSWRYSFTSKDSDTSVFGWQMMALKSALMSNLEVNPAKVERARKWMATVQPEGENSQSMGLFGYQAGNQPTPSMTSVGLLITQYLGATKDDPVVAGGVRYLMKHPPDAKARDTYYWYYATQVMHNMCDADWDAWNRKMRKLLVETQCKTGCAAGSWDPGVPARDNFGTMGGRVMMTSLSALTLEVYYRYLPLYQLDKEEAKK